MLPHNLLDWKCAILAINKYKFVTSAKLVDEIKFIIHDNVGDNHNWLKLGHGGTLDATATGVLVVGTGMGCKLLSKFLEGGKRYKVKAMLGVETDTLNDRGIVTKEASFEHVTRQSIICAAKRFQGKILQEPPKYSALKVGGQRISDLTKAGIDVPMVARMVVCHSIEVVSYSPPFLELDVKCGGGFYIRSLVRDLANALGTCGHVTELHRTQHGFLTEQDAISRENWTYPNLIQNARQIRRKSEFKELFANFARF